MSSLADWSARRWLIAAAAAVATALAVGVPTDVIPNPVFGRQIGITWWSYPSLVVTSILAGLLVATYVRAPDEPAHADLDRPGKVGGFGGFLSFFAVGCPTCNKLVLVALGSSGAVDWFAPAQPVLAVASIALLGWALRARLRSVVACPINV